MQFVKLGCAALTLACVAPGTALAKKPKSIRTVQVITMVRAPMVAGASASAEAPDTATEDTSAMRPPMPSNFHADDLSRRWVEFDMDSSFASPAMTTPVPNASGAGPFARVNVARRDPNVGAEGLPRTPLVAIPHWMRTGLALSAATTTFVPGCAASEYRPTGFLRPDAEGRRLGYYAMMSSIACEYGLPVGLFDAMIIRESRYQADIASPKNAFGLTQLMPDTAAGLGINRYDIEQNLRGGARYLRQQLDRFGQVSLALAAYNAGPGRVKNGMLPRIEETQSYVENVLTNWRRLAGFAPMAAMQNVEGQATRPLRPIRLATISAF